MKKFVLIDQTIIDNRGHYLQYANSVLECAKSQGYQTVLVTNKRYSSEECTGHQIYPIFKYTYWESLTNYREPEGANDVEPQVPANITPERTRKGIRSSKLYRKLWKNPLRIWLTKFIRRLLGQNFERVKMRLKPPEPETPEIVIEEESVYKAGCFKEDLKKAIELASLREDDILFIPTISEIELMGVVSMLQESPEVIQTPLHLLFRRNIFLNRREHYSEELSGLQVFCNTLKQCEEFSAAGKLFFYTDTDELTEQYNRLSMCFFSTLPIPHTVCREMREGEQVPPYQISYLGDARAEKGYLYLPELITTLTENENKRGRFFIQSNYNIPGGEQGIPEAREQLEKMLDQGVTLEMEALDSEKYISAIKSTDIMLILYDPKQYYARSSGIFAEAMSAGIPAIVPADTWMSHQVCGGRYKQIEEQLDLPVPHRALVPVKLSKKDVRLELFCEGNEDKLAVALNLDWKDSGSSIRVAITELDHTGRCIAHDIQFVEQFKDEMCYFTLFLHQGTKTVWMDCTGTYGQKLPRFLNASIIPLRSDSPILRERICAICDDFTCASEKIEEMLSNYNDQRESTVNFSYEWYNYHNADTLIQNLRDNTERRKSRRQPADGAPKVSIVVPVYNKGKYLKVCLDSVINQTIDSLEVVCVDDESTDGSIDILRAYAAEFPCIRVYEQKNAGVSAARNTALEYCKGEFVIFLDADDFYPRADSLDVMYDTARKFHVEVVCGKIGPNYYERTANIFNKAITIDDYQHDLGFTAHLFCRRRIEKMQLRFPSLRHYEDPVFCLPLLCASKQLVCLDMVMYYYRITDNNGGNVEWTSRRICDYITGLETNLQLAEKNGLKILYNDLCGRVLYLYDYILCGNEQISKEDAAYDRFFAMIHGLNITMLEGKYGRRLKSMVGKMREDVPHNKTKASAENAGGE